MSEQAVRVERLVDYSDRAAAGIGELMPDLSDRLSDDPIPEERLRAIIESPDRDQFVAYMHSKIVGAATLNLIVGTVGKKAWLEDFVTSSAEDVRGAGVGHSIWLELLEWCRERDVENLSFTSNPARNEAHRFYLRQGAKMIDTDVFKVEIDAAGRKLDP
jgi:GNAT superfamily N-acetyltransferase